MGGLYISPSSSEISWKRRAIRVSSEALLCLGVATIVASFVVDISPEAQKPNVWILIGGLIMIVASAIGWSLTFCLMFDPDQQAREDNTFTGIVISHTKQDELPLPPKKNFLGKTFSSSDNGGMEKLNLGAPGRAHTDQNTHQVKVKVKKMKAVDKNAPLHSVEVVVPQAFLNHGGNIATLPDKISPHMFDQFFSQKNILTGSNTDLIHSGSSEYSNNSQLPGYSKMPGNYDPEVAHKLGKVPPIPRDQKKMAGYDDSKDGRVAKDVTRDVIARERERARSKRPNKPKPTTGKPTSNNQPQRNERGHQNQNNQKTSNKHHNTNNKVSAKEQTGRRDQNNQKKEKVQKRRSDTESSSQSSLTNTYSTETETLSHSSYTDSKTPTSKTSSYTDSYSQDYEEVKYDKRTGERIRRKEKPRANPMKKSHKAAKPNHQRMRV